MKSVVFARRSSRIAKDHRRSFVALRFCSRRMRMGRHGPTSGSPMPSTVACKRSRMSDVRIADAFNCRVQTIENVRKRLVTEGFELALEGKKRQEPPTPCKLDGEAEAKLIAMRLGKPPAGYGHWTLQLLADEVVALEIVDSISHETVRKVLKKTA